jgi:hypothetical protein
MPALLCHPIATCPAIRSLKVSVTPREAGGLALGYRLTGEITELLLPETAPCEPADELWRHTCFEAFIAASGSPAYREFNFSPSRQWAAYAFTDYRQRAVSYAPSLAPEIALHSSPDGLELDAWVPAELLPEGRDMYLGLSAVIEARDGSLSYWALTHPATRPDFHLRAGFTVRLPETCPPTP